MIQDTDDGILSKSDLLILRDRKLHEFLSQWLIEHPMEMSIVIEEQVVFGDQSTTSHKQFVHGSHKQASISFPLNWITFGLDALMDYVVQQVYNKITDIPWDKNITDFRYVEVVFTGINDFASLYPTMIKDPTKTLTFTPDRYETRKQNITKK